MEERYLTIRSLTKVYNPGTSGEVNAINDLSLSLDKGEFLVIVGSNAAGKSTLLNIISGNLKPTHGDVLLNGKSLIKISEHKKAQFISKVKQEPNHSLATSMTLAENMSMAKLRSLKVGLKKGVKKEWKKEFQEILAPFGIGLEKRLDDRVDLLSGGQKQTVALLMATMTKPELLLLDEHTAALDPKVSKVILDITQKLVVDHKITTLMITHNMSHALHYGDRLVLMQSGKIKYEAFREEKQKLSVADIIKKIEDSGIEI
jgi:putative tryptophan/tyrosine transport system ATP-binding protein